MNLIAQMITQKLAGAASQQIAQRLGISEGAANSAVQIAVPLILAALARNAAQPQGAQDLHQAVASDHDGSILDNLMGYLGNPEQGNGSGILGHVLGDQRPSVENNLAQATGLDQNSAGSLMEMLAPVVMGAVGRTQQQNGLDSGGLADYLGQQQQAQPESSGVMGMLSSMLDSNKDGNVTDDLAKLAGGFFK
ncbi:MAG TPA: DUF937 domain-containing protein [Pyrinomonadaceae bacterium]|nr:DUF937 domain-containing protein [Pyrinomonadaceae bacterium]